MDYQDIQLLKQQSKCHRRYPSKKPKHHYTIEACRCQLCHRLPLLYCSDTPLLGGIVLTQWTDTFIPVVWLSILCARVREQHPRVMQAVFNRDNL
jgi:hypothetical protein